MYLATPNCDINVGTITIGHEVASIRFNNVQRVFAIGAEAEHFITNEEDSPIMPYAIILGWTTMFGCLRIDPESKKYKSPEEIWNLFWVPVPPTPAHKFWSIGRVVSTPIVTRAQKHLLQYKDQLTNKGYVTSQVVSKFKTTKWNGKTASNITALDVEMAPDAIQAQASEYLKDVMTLILEKVELVNKIMTTNMPRNAMLVPLCNDRYQNDIIKQKFLDSMDETPYITVEALPMLNGTGEDFPIP